MVKVRADRRTWLVGLGGILLGPTLAAIAREKAGIFRPGVPALAATGTTEAREVLQAEARRVGAPLRLYREPDHQAPSSPVPPQDLSTAAVPPT